MINRKRELLEKYHDLHIYITRFKHLVYALVDNKLQPINKVNEPYRYRWFYRYGINGKNNVEIDEPLLMKNLFTDESDSRIRYE